jgi:methyltransferase family protein
MQARPGDTLGCMPDWQERITRESEPELRVEHELRYELAAPLIRGAALWCDLGCGNGVAAARVVASEPPRRSLLVDVDPRAVEVASTEVAAEGVATLVADLASADDLARVRAVLVEQAGDGPKVVTCFETIEHLESFVPLVEALAELAEDEGFTVVASVPNDAFWSLENPHHHTMWGEGAFEELRRLLPRDHVVLRQVPLQGSAVVNEGAPDDRTVAVSADPDGVPSHLLVAFGPEARRLAPGARVIQADLEEQRLWVRQRESHLAYLEQEAETLRAEVQSMSKEFEEWRRYIHDLEGKLGLPPSGEPRSNGARADDEVRDPAQ